LFNYCVKKNIFVIGTIDNWTYLGDKKLSNILEKYQKMK